MITVRGKAKINWKPNYTLTFTSSEGLSLNPGDTTSLVATLTNTADGTPVPNRKIMLTTNPTPRTGDEARKTTNAEGVATFTGITNPSVESVVYTASLIPKPATSLPTVTTDLTIEWGGTVCTTCNADIQSSPAERFGSDPVGGFGYATTYTLRTTSGDGCAIVTDVTHATGTFYVFPDGIGLEPDYSSFDVNDVTLEYVQPMTDQEIDDEIAAMEIVRLAAVAVLEADQC